MSGYRDCAHPEELIELDRLNGEIGVHSEHLEAASRERRQLINRLVHRFRARRRTRVDNVSRETNHPN